MPVFYWLVGVCERHKILHCVVFCLVVTVEFGVGSASVSEGERCVSVVLVKTGTTTVSSSLLFTTMDGGAIGNR